MPTNDPPFTTWTDTATINTGVQWNRNIIHDDSATWNGPIETSRIRLMDLDLGAYTEAEIRDFCDYLDAHLRQKYPPTPPKFASIEEAEAWMEEHYGQ